MTIEISQEERIAYLITLAGAGNRLLYEVYRDGDDDTRRSILKAMAAHAMGQLPQHLREVVELRLHGQMSHAEIGEVVGVSEATARSRLRYALNRLRELLKHAKKA